MKKLLVLFLVFLAVMAGWAVTALAQDDPTIVFTNNPAPTTFINDTHLHANVGTGIYTGTINSVSTSFICDDDLNIIHTNDVWNAYTFYLSNVATYGNGQYAVPSGNAASGTSIYTASGDSISPTPTIQQDYDMAAYLADLLLTKAYTGSAAINTIQWAIWDIMDSPNANGLGDPGGTSCTSTYTATGPTNTSCGKGWVNFVAAYDKNYSNPYIVFYTPTQGITSGPDKSSCTYAQEFIGLSTPEPISMALMGTFLSLAGLGLGKKKLFS